MDSLFRFLKANRMRIESIFSGSIWPFRCSNPILECLHITTSCNNYVCYTTLTALKAHDTCLWYLDSGTVTYGDGSKSVIREIERIDIPGLPMFEDVWFMDGLKANLLSISQICDNGMNVLFTKYECEILDERGDCICVGIRTTDNCYSITPSINHKCYSVKINQVDLWRQRLGHTNHKQIEKISKCEEALELPKFEKIEKNICGPCQISKQVKPRNPSISEVQTTRPLELLHIDLMGPTRVQNLGGMKYIPIVVDDFTRYTWVVLLKDKSEAVDKMIHLCKKLQVEKNIQIAQIKSDHGREFENSNSYPFVMIKGQNKNSLHPRHLSKMELLKEKNRVIQEIAKVMINNKSMSKSFWGEAVSIACHTLNRVYFRPNTKKTPYELWRGKKPGLKYFRVFGSDYYILRDRENLEKFDAKSDKGFFLGYSTSSKAYQVYNLRKKTVMESTNVVINDEQCAETHTEEAQQVQERSIKVEDALPKEYVQKSIDEELLILRDSIGT